MKVMDSKGLRNFEPQDVKDAYDYVIAGGGTAGCLVAARLVQYKPNATILVLERGQDEDNNPALKFQTQDSVILPVAYETIPATVEFSIETTRWQGVIRTDSYKVIYPWALGGGPTVSGAFWGRGDPANFAEWAALGNTGWSYNDVLPFYKALENYKQPFYSSPVDPSRGTSGPIKTIGLDGLDASIEPLIQSLSNVTGVNVIVDYNTPAGQLGIGPMQRNTGHDLNNAVRNTTYNQILKPLIGTTKKLQVLPSATVTRINWENGGGGKKQAKSIEFLYLNDFYRVKIRKELIISAGAMNTPHLLLVSGVGPAAHLNERNVPLVMDLPGVGRNLQDHMVFTHTIVMNPAAFPDLTDPTPPMIMFSMSDPSTGKIDLELAWSVLPPFGPGAPPVLVMYLVGVRNAFRGFVQLKNNDTLYRPYIQFNLATVDSDFNKIIFLFRQVKAWFAQMQAAGLALIEVGTFADIAGDAPDSAWLDILRVNADDWWHSAGTCKMGPDSDPMAVVTPRLRLRNTTNVRIADNSVQPVVVSVHPTATAMVIGDRCARFINEDSAETDRDLVLFPDSDNEDDEDEEYEPTDYGKLLSRKARQQQSNASPSVATSPAPIRQRRKSQTWFIITLFILLAISFWFMMPHSHGNSCPSFVQSDVTVEHDNIGIGNAGPGMQEVYPASNN